MFTIFSCLSNSSMHLFPFLCLSPFSHSLFLSMSFTLLQLLLLSNICPLWQPLKPRLISNSLTHQVYAMQYHLAVSASVSVGVLVASGSLPDNCQLTNLPTHQAPGKAPNPFSLISFYYAVAWNSFRFMRTWQMLVKLLI